MAKAIVLIIVGLLLLVEVSVRVFGWKYPTEFTYRICRPFWMSCSMRIGLLITMVEIIVGAILTYNGFVGLF